MPERTPEMVGPLQGGISNGLVFLEKTAPGLRQHRGRFFQMITGLGLCTKH